MKRYALLLVASLLGVGLHGCSSVPPGERAGEKAAASAVRISVVGTGDLHGHLEHLPVLAGYLRNLRAVRESEGGGVLLLDAGDLFQGTLESNLSEGASVIEAFAALGYDAVAIGNHEFDFGPAGPAATAGPGEDPRGALRARAASAPFPFLMGNVVEARSGEIPDWENVSSEVLVAVAGVEVGIVGVTTEETLQTTMPANVRDLEMRPLVETIERSAASLRRRGAAAVIVVAHAGGRCHDFDEPGDLSSCEPDQEIFRVASQLSSDAVDLIVAGHTHAGIAHRVHAIPIIESFAYGSAFGRVDLMLAGGRVVETRIHRPQDLCRDRRAETCVPFDYEGAPVAKDTELEARLAPAFERARELKQEPLGVVVAAPIRGSLGGPSALGDLVTDLMLAARPEADLAITNAGGLRADLPAGELTYGSLYESLPFDNLFARIELSGADAARLVAISLSREVSFFSFAGLRAVARCEGGKLRVELERPDGERVRPDERLVLATSDFLATGGDFVIDDLGLPAASKQIVSGPTLRDQLAEALRRRGGTLDPATFFDPEDPRIRFPGTIPVRCDG